MEIIVFVSLMNISCLWKLDENGEARWIIPWNPMESHGIPPDHATTPEGATKVEARSRPGDRAE